MNSEQDLGRVGLPDDAATSPARVEFITRTYNHLMGAIVAFVGVELLIFGAGWAQPMAEAMLGVSWLFVLGAFMIVGWIASRAAGQAESLPAQYAALGGYVIAEAIIFVPMLYIAESYAGGVIQSAAIVTLMAFAGLTAVVFVTRKDFSFLRSFVLYGMVLGLVAIVAGAIFGFQLGTWFSVGMVGLAGAAILYDTSNVMHHYPEGRYVAAALALFASVALMFWYVLSLFMSRD